jgi:proteic killer suppression protein
MMPIQVALDRTKYNALSVCSCNWNAATRPEDMNIAGYRFHALHGRPRRYSVTVTRTWRIIFEWDGEDVVRVDYEDYH